MRYENYIRGITPDQIEYWNQLDTKAKNKIEELATASVTRFDYDKWLADFEATRKKKSKGTSFEDWKQEFNQSLRWSTIQPEAVSEEHLSTCYHADQDGCIAGWNYRDKYDPIPEDPELLAQRNFALEKEKFLHEQEQIHKERVEETCRKFTTANAI